MRRTVKAWCAMFRNGTLLPGCARYNRRIAEAVAATAWSDGDPAKAVPVTITYNDGRPAPRKRTTGKQGKKGGRRG